MFGAPYVLSRFFSLMDSHHQSYHSAFTQINSFHRLLTSLSLFHMPVQKTHTQSDTSLPPPYPHFRHYSLASPCALHPTPLMYSSLAQPLQTTSHSPTPTVLLLFSFHCLLPALEVTRLVKSDEAIYHRLSPFPFCLLSIQQITQMFYHSNSSTS